MNINIIIRTRRDDIELEEPTKLINTRRVSNIRKFNMEKVKQTFGDRGVCERVGSFREDWGYEE